MISAYKNDQCCGNCAWHDDFSWACFNGDSEYCADFTRPTCTCDQWTPAAPDSEGETEP